MSGKSKQLTHVRHELTVFDTCRARVRASQPFTN